MPTSVLRASTAMAGSGLLCDLRFPDGREVDRRGKDRSCIETVKGLLDAVSQYLSLGFEQRHWADPHYSNVDRNRDVVPNS
jgi:hypothetical protein